MRFSWGLRLFSVFFFHVSYSKFILFRTWFVLSLQLEPLSEENLHQPPNVNAMVSLQKATKIQSTSQDFFFFQKCIRSFKLNSCGKGTRICNHVCNPIYLNGLRSVHERMAQSSWLLHPPLSQPCDAAGPGVALTINTLLQVDNGTLRNAHRKGPMDRALRIDGTGAFWIDAPIHAESENRLHNSYVNLSNWTIPPFWLWIIICWFLGGAFVRGIFIAYYHSVISPACSVIGLVAILTLRVSRNI